MSRFSGFHVFPESDNETFSFSTSSAGAELRDPRAPPETGMEPKRIRCISNIAKPQENHMILYGFHMIWYGFHMIFIMFSVNAARLGPTQIANRT